MHQRDRVSGVLTVVVPKGQGREELIDRVTSTWIGAREARPERRGVRFGVRGAKYDGYSAEIGDGKTNVEPTECFLIDVAVMFPVGSEEPEDDRLSYGRSAFQGLASQLAANFRGCPVLLDNVVLGKSDFTMIARDEDAR